MFVETLWLFVVSIIFYNKFMEYSNNGKNIKKNLIITAVSAFYLFNNCFYELPAEMLPHFISRFSGLIIFFILIANIVILGCLNNVEEKSLNERAVKLDKIIICPVCPGESIDQSQHPLSVQMRAAVKEKLDKGWDERRIRQFFVERYGPRVLLEPPTSGVHLAAWIIPPIGIIIAIVALYAVLKSMHRSQSKTIIKNTVEPEFTIEEKEEYFSRIESALSTTQSSNPEIPPNGEVRD